MRKDYGEGVEPILRLGEQMLTDIPDSRLLALYDLSLKDYVFCCYVN